MEGELFNGSPRRRRRKWNKVEDMVGHGIIIPPENGS
jgi:hypothetical protein